jgi:two-component system CheB/CheR fusion protein
MGDMLAMIAHQWRQPLSIISMSTSTLKAHLELEEAIPPQEMQHLIVTINEQAHYLSHTIDDFRNFFKPDNVKEKTTLTAIFERLATLVQKSMENNAIALKFPTTNGEIAIFTYPNQLLQSLINIITNAKDAIKEHHTIQGVIHISLSVKPEEIIIEICDNGGGIDPSITKKIGEPYVTTKASNGTGLGLYMSKIIIEKHLGGRLWWSSDSIGSCFSIALPKGSLK